MFGSFIVALLLGIFPKIASQKPLWWKLTIIISVALSLILTLYPPISGNLNDTIYLKKGTYQEINLHLDNDGKDLIKVNGIWTKVIGKEQAVNSTFDSLAFKNKLIIKSEIVPDEFKHINKLIIKVALNKEFNALEYKGTIAINPLLEYPFVANLGERIRILNLHVPLAWICVVAYLMSMVYAIRYLKTKELIWDFYTTSTAALGTVFAILATVTGMLWAKFNWGAYWNWDPRQTSILVLIMIYLAYFALRSAIDNEERKATLSSVYSIIAFVTVPFLVFILPRLTSGLHPGSADDTNSGPLVTPQQNSLDTTLIYGFGLALLSFTLLYFWMLNLMIRYKKISYELNEG